MIRHLSWTMTRRVVRLADTHRRQIVERCREALPLEGCGLVAMSGDTITAVYPTENADESSDSYAIPPEQHYAALVDAERNGWRLGGVFHSHPRGTVEMSMIDRDRALDPDWVYLVCDPTSGDLAAWSSEGQRLEILRNQTGPSGNY